MSSIHPFSEVLQNLKQQGYTVNFSIAEDGLMHSAGNDTIYPEDFTIDKTFKVASMFEPADEVMVYAISSQKYHIKGIFTSSDEIENLSLLPPMTLKFAASSDSLNSSKTSKIESQSTVRATVSRPEGGRALNKEMLTFDTEALINQIKSEEAWKRSERNSLTIFKNETLCMVIVGLKPDAAMKKHSAAGAITVQVLHGKIIFETENQKSELSRGMMIALPAGIPHQVYAAHESFFLLTLALQK